MSFFIKNKSKKQNGKHDKKKGVKRKLYNAREEKKREDDELTSSSDEEVINNNKYDEESSEDELETAQEKKLKLAKIYLEEIEKQEQQRFEDKNLHKNVNQDIISQRLKEDYLRQTGRLKTNVAELYKGADLENAKILKCKKLRNAVTCMCVTDDNTWLFTGSKCGTLVKWSLKDYKKILALPYAKKQPETTTNSVVSGHTKSITSIAVSSDAKYLACGDESNVIHVWNPETLKHIHTFTGHRKGVTGLVFRKDTHTLYSCSKDRSIKVWSLDEMSYVETLYGHQDGITSIDALTRERAITSGGKDVSIRIWKIAEESQLIYNGNRDGSIDIVRLINEENFVSGGDDGQISVWSAMKKKPLCSVKDAHGINEMNRQPNWICALGTLLNTDLVASGSHNGDVKLWKLQDGFRRVDLLFTIPIQGFVNCLNFTTDGKFLIAAIGTEHRFGRWDVIKTAKNHIIVIPLLKQQ